MLARMLMMVASIGGIGLYNTASYRAYRTCIASVVAQAAHAGTVPEDLPMLLRQACPEQRAMFADEIVRRAHRPPTDDGAAENAREVEARSADLLGEYARRYTVYFATGTW